MVANIFMHAGTAGSPGDHPFADSDIDDAGRGNSGVKQGRCWDLSGQRNRAQKNTGDACPITKCLDVVLKCPEGEAEELAACQARLSG